MIKEALAYYQQDTLMIVLFKICLVILIILILLAKFGSKSLLKKYNLDEEQTDKWLERIALIHELFSVATEALFIHASPECWQEYLEIFFWGMVLFVYIKHVIRNKEFMIKKLIWPSICIFMIVSSFAQSFGFTAAGRQKNFSKFLAEGILDTDHSSSDHKSATTTAFEITGFLWDQVYLTKENGHTELVFEHNGKEVASTGWGMIAGQVECADDELDVKYTPKDHVKFEVEEVDEDIVISIVR